MHVLSRVHLKFVKNLNQLFENSKLLSKHKIIKFSMYNPEHLFSKWKKSGLECIDEEPDTYIDGLALGPWKSGKSAEECRNHCQATPDCTAWVWYYTNRCSLKGTGGAEAPRDPLNGFVSGLRNCKGEREPKLNPKAGLDHHLHPSHHKLF